MVAESTAAPSRSSRIRGCIGLAASPMTLLTGLAANIGELILIYRFLASEFSLTSISCLNSNNTPFTFRVRFNQNKSQEFKTTLCNAEEAHSHCDLAAGSNAVSPLGS
ncbi:hypothetical protein M434DRAFT_211772 [Hypoxylon sp. CO27-5]|nr:hypothetical protein M434DRAFT_211772 [Hypoxylon sp. CO27-5]